MSNLTFPFLLTSFLNAKFFFGKMFLGMQIKTALRPLQLLQVRNLSSQFKSKREKSFFRQESLSNEPVVDQFVKYIMKDGLKARAQRIINTSLEFIALKTKENPRAVLEKAVDQISPYVKVHEC